MSLTPSPPAAPRALLLPCVERDDGSLLPPPYLVIRATDPAAPATILSLVHRLEAHPGHRFQTGRYRLRPEASVVIGEPFLVVAPHHPFYLETLARYRAERECEDRGAWVEPPHGPGADFLPGVWFLPGLAREGQAGLRVSDLEVLLTPTALRDLAARCAVFSAFAARPPVRRPVMQSLNPAA